MPQAFNPRVSTHSRPKAAAGHSRCFLHNLAVSTHSRPKAAAYHAAGGFMPRLFQHTAARRRLLFLAPNRSSLFWFQHTAARRRLLRKTGLAGAALQFQHTAARRRLHCHDLVQSHCFAVSTHSRPKAAAWATSIALATTRRFNTQPPEGGCRRQCGWFLNRGGFNTQPPEGGCAFIGRIIFRGMCFNTQPPEGGCLDSQAQQAMFEWFQHTAARRRLRYGAGSVCEGASFNTQPPEGGCLWANSRAGWWTRFQHTAARRRLPKLAQIMQKLQKFQHTAARRRLLLS